MTRAWVLALSACVVACTPHAGSVPMAGQRNPSTACVFGLRGVRVALDDTAHHGIDVTLSMSANATALRQRAHALLAEPGSDLASLDTNKAPQRLEIRHQLVTARLEDIASGVRIRIVPDAASDANAVVDELEARIERASEDKRCD